MALTPEQLQQLMQLGSMDEQDSDLQQQLAQAQALGAPTEQQAITPTAAVLGGLGNIFKGLTAHRQEGDIRRKRDDLQRKKSEARQLFAQQLGFGAPPPQAAPGSPESYGALFQGYAPSPNAPPQSLAANGPAFGAGPYGYNPGGGGY